MKPKLEIVKIGGKLIDDENLLNTALKYFVKSKNLKILVHGGGSLASNLSKKMGLKPKMIDGRRITQPDDLKVVTMVYAGLINKSIVAQLQSLGSNALGLSGCDLDCIKTKRRIITDIDYGFVGDIVNINSEGIDFLLGKNLLPVFSAITHDGDGQLLNTNADTIAAEIAIALSSKYKTRLIYCFEKNGVLLNEDDENSVISEINKATFSQYKMSGEINGGMIPKLENCFKALQKGVSEIRIGKAEIIDDTTQLYTKLIL